MLRSVLNWFRKKFRRPVSFDLKKAIEEAMAEADADLERLNDPEVLAEVQRWEHEPDPITDGIGCQCGGHEDDEEAR